MAPKELTEVYEELKELRREGLEAKVQSWLRSQLRAMYDDIVRQGRPDRFAEPSDADLFRVLEIKIFAGRVFADQDKAEAWLQRPNTALSGQRPADLLKDELGTAVVREMLEQIDHGIFA